MLARVFAMEFEWCRIAPGRKASQGWARLQCSSRTAQHFELKTAPWQVVDQKLSSIGRLQRITECPPAAVPREDQVGISLSVGGSLCHHRAPSLAPHVLSQKLSCILVSPFLCTEVPQASPAALDGRCAASPSPHICWVMCSRSAAPVHLLSITCKSKRD